MAMCVIHVIGRMSHAGKQSHDLGLFRHSIVDSVEAGTVKEMSIPDMADLAKCADRDYIGKAPSPASGQVRGDMIGNADLPYIQIKEFT